MGALSTASVDFEPGIAAQRERDAMAKQSKNDTKELIMKRKIVANAYKNAVRMGDSAAALDILERADRITAGANFSIPNSQDVAIAQQKRQNVQQNQAQAFNSGLKGASGPRPVGNAQTAQNVASQGQQPTPITKPQGWLETAKGIGKVVLGAARGALSGGIPQQAGQSKQPDPLSDRVDLYKRMSLAAKSGQNTGAFMDEAKRLGISGQAFERVRLGVTSRIGAIRRANDASYDGLTAQAQYEPGDPRPEGLIDGKPAWRTLSKMEEAGKASLASSPKAQKEMVIGEYRAALDALKDPKGTIESDREAREKISRMREENPKLAQDFNTIAIRRPQEIDEEKITKAMASNPIFKKPPQEAVQSLVEMKKMMDSGATDDEIAKEFGFDSVPEIGIRKFISKSLDRLPARHKNNYFASIESGIKKAEEARKAKSKKK